VRGVIHTTPAHAARGPLRYGKESQVLFLFFHVLQYNYREIESAIPLARAIWWPCAPPCVPPPRRRRTFYVYTLWTGGTGVASRSRRKEKNKAWHCRHTVEDHHSSIMIIHPPSSSSSILRRVVQYARSLAARGTHNSSPITQLAPPYQMRWRWIDGWAVQGI